MKQRRICFSLFSNPTWGIRYSSFWWCFNFSKPSQKFISCRFLGGAIPSSLQYLRSILVLIVSLLFLSIEMERSNLVVGVRDISRNTHRKIIDIAYTFFQDFAISKYNCNSMPPGLSRWWSLGWFAKFEPRCLTRKGLSCFSLTVSLHFSDPLRLFSEHMIQWKLANTSITTQFAI